MGHRHAGPSRGHSIECRAGIALGVIGARVSVENRGVFPPECFPVEGESRTLSVAISRAQFRASPARWKNSQHLLTDTARGRLFRLTPSRSPPCSIRSSPRSRPPFGDLEKSSRAHGKMHESPPVVIKETGVVIVEPSTKPPAPKFRVARVQNRIALCALREGIARHAKSRR